MHEYTSGYGIEEVFKSINCNDDCINDDIVKDENDKDDKKENENEKKEKKMIVI